MEKEDKKVGVNKVNLAIKSAIIGLFIGFVALTFTASAETIDGRKVYVDNPRLYFEAVPHTIQTGDDVINFKFNSKQYTGDIDIAFGFDTNIIKPKSAELYRNDEWDDVTGAFNHVSHDYGDMTDWYYTQSVSIDAGQTYDFRVNFNVVNLGSGKYWVCAKPSSQTIAQAIAADNFLCLDPWFNVSYLYKNRVWGNVSSISTNTTGLIPIDITLNSSQLIWPNFSVSNVNNTAGYIYWNSDSDYICVNHHENESVTCITDWGNGSTYRTGDDSIVAWYNFNGSGQDIGVYGHDTSVTGFSYLLGKLGLAADLERGESDYSETTLTTSPYTNGFSFETWLWIESGNTMFLVDNRNAFTVPDSAFNCLYTVGINGFNCEVSNGTGISFVTTKGNHTLSTWEHLIVTHDPVASELILYFNGELKAVKTLTGTVNFEETFIIGQSWNKAGGNFFDGKIDNMRLWNRTLTENEAELLYYTQNDPFPYGNVQTQGNITPPGPEPEDNITFNDTVIYQITGDLPIINTSCDNNSLVTWRGRTTYGLSGAFVSLQRDILECPNGCNEETIMGLGEAGCVETDFLLALIIIIFGIVFSALVIWVLKK